MGPSKAAIFAIFVIGLKMDSQNENIHNGARLTAEGQPTGIVSWQFFLFLPHHEMDI